MEKLINLLHTGGYSCTIANGGKIRTFTQRGVADLYDLLTQEPEFLKGALIADKVVGKGAAALMILGGIKELYTDIISTKALELFRKSDVKVDFAQEVAFIWNRDRTGGCPVETMCSEVESVEEILPLIRHSLLPIPDIEFRKAVPGYHSLHAKPPGTAHSAIYILLFVP